jgi:acetoin utilization protein AcuB
MTQPMPLVRDFMTPSPFTVGAEQTIAFAHTLLYEHRVRHLPVLRGGQLVGLLSERDLALIASLRDVDPHKLQVEEAMSLSVYKVTPEAPLDQVAAEMATRKYGSAVVLEHGVIVGIFTTVDACTALAAMLKGRA